MTDIAVGRRSRPSRQSNTPMPQEARDADAGFYLTMVLISAAIIFVGFAPSFYLKSVIHAPPPLSLLTMTHGVVFTGWLLLFITQAALIAVKRPALHRQLGMMGALLFGIVAVLGMWTAIVAARLGHAPPGAPPPLAFFALPFFAITAAFVLVAGALWNRQRSAWHKRLMLASLFIMTGPGTGRIAIPLGLAPQGSQLAISLAELLLVVAMVYDYRKHGTVHRAYWAAVCVFVAFHLAVTWAFGSPAWTNFATALTAG
jgi:hypothetical protein